MISSRLRRRGLTQPRVQAYRGVYQVDAYDDVFINSQAATTNHASETYGWLAAYQNNWDNTSFTRHLLLRFDLSSLPIGTISSVSLRLMRPTAGSPSPSSGTGFQARALLREYVVDEATWNVYSTGNSWGSAGARASSDRGSTIAGVTDGGSAFASPEVAYTIDVTAIVTPMVGGVAKLLATYLTSNNGTRTYTSSAQPHQRPALLLNYR